MNLFTGSPAGEKVWEFGRGVHIPAGLVCGKALKREQKPDRLAGTDRELIAERGRLIRRSE